MIVWEEGHGMWHDRGGTTRNIISETADNRKTTVDNRKTSVDNRKTTADNRKTRRFDCHPFAISQFLVAQIDLDWLLSLIRLAEDGGEPV